MLGTDYMQMTGRHYMGAGLKQEVDKEALKLAREIEEQKQMAYVDNVMEKDKDCKPIDDKVLVPVSSRVILLPYDKNPYRVPLQKSQSGLILGDFETAATYKSQDTGEEEASKRGIWCCKVIAVGPECKYVGLGDDVYINFTMAAPVPFGGKGYYSISESNIICSIKTSE